MDKILDVHSDVLGPIRSVQQGMELARANVLWNLKNYNEIIEWLKDQKVFYSTGNNKLFLLHKKNSHKNFLTLLLKSINCLRSIGLNLYFSQFML